MKTLILYFTTDGQTKKIAERLADVIRHEVELISLKDQAVDFAQKMANVDQVVIGASIRYGHFNPLVYQFIEQHYAMLNEKKTAFYGVNLTARKANRNTPTTNTYIRNFLAKVKWQPNYVEVIAGALFYPRYRFIDRMMIRFIMKITKGETDVSKEYEYTNWQQVEEFGKKLSDQLI
ncbi:menaquinone-dependent protoporphyrinogen IX dehydrogenase [Mannheimia pernigra]|uniref:Protoporphyrinogen IX dehydrogenase [quinone] n=1 Tax=Mannheimia pernigra TaxID=111844 RepID=A0A7D5DXF9_9PAST|nr:menaquinone-dependent protoporphyrinogen IX dehydrogenase [Mannheimia pernigra]QLB39823.1 menaquinone-dependent protoporphyrinogen IX dehydrogenase [Mannheimia pernigra]